MNSLKLQRKIKPEKGKNPLQNQGRIDRIGGQKGMQNLGEPILQTRKDVLAILPGRSERYVSDMKRAGLRFPTTRTEVFSFLRRCPAPSRIRSRKRGD